MSDQERKSLPILPLLTLGLGCIWVAISRQGMRRLFLAIWGGLILATGGSIWLWYDNIWLDSSSQKVDIIGYLFILGGSLSILLSGIEFIVRSRADSDPAGIR